MTAAYYVTNDANMINSDAFCLFYDAQSKTVKALNGSGRSPAKLTIDHVRSQGVTGNSIPGTNLNSVTVPGRLYGRYSRRSENSLVECRLCGRLGRHCREVRQWQIVPCRRIGACDQTRRGRVRAHARVRNHRVLTILCIKLPRHRNQQLPVPAVLPVAQECLTKWR